MRGPLVPADSFVVLWTGGLWNWFDPATLLHGLAGAVARNPRIRLVVMAAGHASEDWTAHRAGEDAEALATQLGLTQSGHVMFAGRWVPFEERGGFLAEADLGVCSTTTPTKPDSASAPGTSTISGRACRRCRPQVGL